MADARAQAQGNIPSQSNRPPAQTSISLQDAQKLRTYQTLLFLKSDHHRSFEVLATTLFFNMLLRGTPSAVYLGTIFLRLYGAALWPSSLSQRDHLELSIGEDRYQAHWRPTDGSPPATVNGPVFLIHAAMADPRNDEELVMERPERHQNRLAELMWRYFAQLIGMGRRGGLQGRVVASENVLMGSIVMHRALVGFSLLEDAEDDGEEEIMDSGVGGAVEQVRKEKGEDGGGDEDARDLRREASMRAFHGMADGLARQRLALGRRVEEWMETVEKATACEAAADL